MTTVQAFAASDPNGPLAPFECEAGPIEPGQVDIDDLEYLRAGKARYRIVLDR
jgi:hypothetical protein